MNDFKLEKENISSLQYTIPFTNCIKSIRIYQLLIQESPYQLVFSFFFRYSSLFSLHSQAQTQASFPAKFPKKLYCICKRSLDRTKDFEQYFESFGSFKNQADFTCDEKITNISQFLKIMGLESNILESEFMDFKKIVNFMMRNPFLFEGEQMKLMISEYLTKNSIIEEIKERKIEKGGLEPQTHNSGFTNEKIKLAFKKEENKIIFLGFLDKKSRILMKNTKKTKNFLFRMSTALDSIY